MRLSKLPNYDVRYFEKTGTTFKPMRLSESSLARYNKLENDGIAEDQRKTVALINMYKIEKPPLLISAERKARIFVRRMGFYAAKGTPIACVETCGEDEYDQIFDEGSYANNIIAMYDPFGIIIIDVRQLKMMSTDGCDASIATILIHELTHAATPPTNTIGRIYNLDAPKGDEWEGYNFRSGFSIGINTDTRGMFYEEALAAHVHGLYVRSRGDVSSVQLNSIVDEPEPAKPDFYDHSLPPKPDGTPYVAGHDAYTIEMIAWRAAQIGITSHPDELISHMYDTLRQRDPQKILLARRAFARIIDSVEEGLYMKLQRVQYGRKEFIQAMQDVYKIVSTG